MKEYGQLQIPFKYYMREFKQCKQIQKNDSFQIFYTRSINTRKKHLVVKKLTCHIQDINTIFSEFSTLQNTAHSPFINKFVGFVIEKYKNQHSGQKMANIYFLFQFGEATLESYIQTIFQRGRQESLSFLHIVYQSMAEISKILQQKTKFLKFDLKLTAIHVQAESLGRVTFSYLPFSFLQQSHFSQKNFTTQIYSQKELDRLNSEQKSDQIQMLFQRKHQNIPTNRRFDLYQIEMKQKMGLFLIKLLLLCCQQVHMRESEVNLYGLNQHFRIDYNWELINPLLTQCKKLNHYKQIANIIESLLNCKDSITESPQKSTAEHKMKSTQKMAQTLKFSSKKHVQTIQQMMTQKMRQIEARILKHQGIVESIQQNGKYVGQMLNGKRQGYGIYYFEQGQIYGGEWKNDEMIGQGIYLFLTQNQYYQGNVEQGTRSGFGCYHYKDGNVYTGNWLNDQKEGYGELLIAKTNQLYKGNFKNNQQHGIGIIEYSNGSKFQGYFQNGLKQGNGQLCNSKNQVTFKGKWVNNQILGKVEIFFENGDNYQGCLKQGLMSGPGIYKYKCGTTYLGQFAENRMCGRCRINYANGDTFEGEMLNGKFSSKGTYYYLKQNISEISHWAEGLQIGITQFICGDKRIETTLIDRNCESLLMHNVA